MKIKHHIADTTSCLEDWFSTFKEFQLDNIFETNVLARAYEYLPLIAITSRSSSGMVAIINQRYTVQLESDGSQVMGICDCPHEKKCKHLAAVIIFSIYQK